MFVAMVSCSEQTSTALARPPAGPNDEIHAYMIDSYGG